jgi:hypothetical protein
MSDSADTLIIKPTSIEINSQPNGNHHSPVNERIVSSVHIDPSVDSGLSSEVTNTEVETSNGGGGDDEVSSIKHKRESSPTSGVIIPEEKRVTDRVKVFEAVANNTEKVMTKNGNNNNNNKKKSSISSSFTIADQKQVSPSSTESFDTQSFNEIKPSKNKSKKSSLKKQIQNLLKIDKPSIQDEDEGKKLKKDSSMFELFID